MPDFRQFATAGSTTGALKSTEVIAEILHPIRRNNLEARRRRLKVSRVALARILDVDPATIYRQERGVMSGTWDYATHGDEAEAPKAKAALREHRKDVDSYSLVVKDRCREDFEVFGDRG